MAEKQGKGIFSRKGRSLKNKSKSKGDELSDIGGASPISAQSISSGGGGGKKKANTSKKKGASSASDLRSNPISAQKKQPQTKETSLTLSPGHQGTAASPPVRSNTLSGGESTRSKSQSTVGPRSLANQSHDISRENRSPLRTKNAPTNSQATASPGSCLSASDPLAAHTPTCDDPQKDLQQQVNMLQVQLEMSESQRETAEDEITQIKHKLDKTVKENKALQASVAKSEDQQVPTKNELTKKFERTKMEDDLSHKEQMLFSDVVEFDSHKEQKEKEPSQQVKDKRSSKSHDSTRKQHEGRTIRERTQQIASRDENDTQNLKDAIQKQIEVEEMHKNQIQMSKNETEQLRRENERLTVEHREALRKALEENEAKITEEKEKNDRETTLASEQLEKERNEKAVLQGKKDELKQHLTKLQQEKDKQHKLLEELQQKHEEGMQQQTKQKETNERETTLANEQLEMERNEKTMLQGEKDELKQRLRQLQQEKDKLLKEMESRWLEKEAQLQQKHEEAMQQQKKWHNEQISEMASTFQTITTKQVTTETIKLKEEHQEQVKKIQEELQTLQLENNKLMARLEEDKNKFHVEKESVTATTKQDHEQKLSLAHHELEQLQKRKTELEQMSKELEEQNMQLQEETAELQERMKADSQEQKVALQVALEQTMENEKSRHEREMADMAAAHKQEIATKQTEVETFQKKLIEKEAQVYQLEQDHFIQSTETEPGENGHSLLEVNQGVESAQPPQPPQTARLNDLDGGPVQAAAQMSNEEKIQRLKSTISNYEKLYKDVKSKNMELKKRLQEEEWSRMQHSPGAAVEGPEQDPEMDCQDDRRRMKEGKFEGANHSTESTALQEQIAELRQKLDQKNREIDEKAHAIADKENELTEIKERLEEQETKREESQHKVELMEKGMKKAAAEGTSPKALQQIETYFEQLINLTQEFSELKIQNEKQKKELENLRKLEKRAKELEEGNFQAATELSQREEELKQLHEVAIQQHTAVEPSREVRKLERKVKELQDKLEEKQEEIQALKRGETPFDDPLGASESVLSSVKDMTTLRIKVKEQQKEINNLRMQIESVTPALHEKDQLSKERERLQREREELEKDKQILVDHTEKQSQIVLALKRQLEASQKSESMPEEQAKEVKEELKRAKDGKASALLEVQKAEQKCEELSVEIEQLKGAAAQVQAQLQQFEKERDDSREEYDKLQSLYEKTKRQAEQVHDLAKQVVKLKETATRMKSENDELKETNELLKMEADQYKKDFDEERRDRERLKDQFDEEHVTTVGVMQTTNEDYKMLKEESRLKDELLQGAQMEINDLKIEIEEKRKLEEEVKAKTAQVKQYQKQIDAMQNQLSAAQKYKVASKSEGPQHQQEQLEKAQLEMVQYKSKLEQVEEELSTLQQHISSKDLEHKEKIDSMTSELQRLHQEESTLKEKLEKMQSGQHQLLQESNKQLAEARLQIEKMATQLRDQQQQQQQWQRREGELAPEQFPPAYTELVFKCQELEKQLDSALDQLDGLSQQKEVLVQELHNRGIKIPYEESKVNQNPNIAEPQKPRSSLGSSSQQNKAQRNLPPHSDADNQHRRQQQQQKQQQQLQQQYHQQHNNAQQAGEAISGGSGKTIPKPSEVITRAEAKSHLLPDKPHPPNRKQNPVEEAVVGILPPGLKIKPHFRQGDKLPPQESSQTAHRHTSTASPANRDTTAAAAMPAQSNAQTQSRTADNSLLALASNSQAHATAGPQGSAVGAGHQLYQQPPNIDPQQQHYGMEQSQANMGGGNMQYNMMQMGPQHHYNRGQQYIEQTPHLPQINRGYRPPPNAGSNPIPASYNPQNAQLQPHQHPPPQAPCAPQQFYHPLPNQQHQAQYQPTMQPPQMMHRQRFQGPPNQVGLNQCPAMPTLATTQSGRPASHSSHPGFQQSPMPAHLPMAGLPNTESAEHIPPVQHGTVFRAHQGPPPPSTAAPEPPIVQDMQGLAQAPPQPIHNLICPEQPSDASADKPAPSAELKLPVTREYSEANSDAAGDGELLLKDLDEEIVDTAADVNHVRSGVIRVPPDPNLHCVYCDKYFGIGEIQKYRRHMETCRGSGQ